MMLVMEEQSWSKSDESAVLGDEGSPDEVRGTEQ